MYSDVNDNIQKMFPRFNGVKFQVIVSLCSYIGALLCGYGSAWSGLAIQKLRDLELSPLPFLLTETQLALVGSLAYFGAVPSPYIVLWLSNKRGRKPCLFISAVVCAIAFIIWATANNLAMIYIGRIMLSGALGIANIMNVVYIGEIASPAIRGILLSVMGVSFTLGLCLLYTIGAYVSYQMISYIGLAISIIFGLSSLCIPESPIIFALQGKDKKLVKVLEDLGRSKDLDELIEMKKELEESNNNKEWTELFCTRCNRKSLFIVIVINILQHSSGFMAIIFYSGSIFEMAGSSVNANLAMVIIGCCQLIGSTIVPFFIESSGRKIVLMISSAVCAVSMFVLGLYFYLSHIKNPVVDSIKWLPLVILVVYYIGYDFGLGVIPNLISGEMFTPRVRSKGSTVAMTSSWLFGFLVTTGFGSLLTTVGGHVSFWFFSGVCVCLLLFAIFFMPETKGKSLLEIQASL